MGQAVPMQTTPVLPADAVSALNVGLTARIGSPPKKNVVRLLLAQIWMESRGGALKNNNVGNLSAGGFVNGVERLSWSGDYWRPPWFSNPSSPTYALMMAGQEPSAFRSYPDIHSGMNGYLDLLSRADMQQILVSAATGDTTAFAQAIKNSHYTPALNVPATARTFDGLLASFDAQGLFDGLSTGIPGYASGAAGASLALALAGLGTLLYIHRKRKAA